MNRFKEGSSIWTFDNFNLNLIQGTIVRVESLGKSNIFTVKDEIFGTLRVPENWVADNKKSAKKKLIGFIKSKICKNKRNNEVLEMICSQIKDEDDD